MHPVSRITIVNRYFWPDTVLANDIAVWLLQEGYEVDVIASQPSYNPEANLVKRPRVETWNGVRILRVPLLPEKNRGLIRQINNLLFILLSTALLLFGAKRKAVWTTSIPPVLQPFFLRIATGLRDARLVYFIQDIYPEIAVLMHMVEASPFTRLVAWLDNWTINKADAVVTLSRDMADAIRARGATRDLVRINNFSAVDGSGKVVSSIADGPCRFVFAGNIGRFQNLERIVDLFADIDPAEATFELLGDGRIKKILEKEAAKRNIRSVAFRPLLPAAEAFTFIQSCDVGVVSLVSGLYSYAYPSKTFTYLAAGLPLLCFIESRSELARDVEARNIGITIDWAAPREDLLAAIRHIIAVRHQMSPHVRENARDLYDRGEARSKWTKLFVELLADEQ